MNASDNWDQLGERGHGDRYAESLRSAEKAVANEATRVLTDIRAGALGEGTWHPNGFATFQRYFEPGLGLVRLHVWPRSLRRAVPRHPEVHSHAFNVYSRVLVGTYGEDLYTISPTSGPSAGLRVYEVDVLGPGKPDLLRDTGATAHLNFLNTLTAPAGSWHDVPAGVFHKTVIPEDMLCATLCILGEHQDGATTRLLGAAGFDVAPRSRPHLTGRERDVVLEQLQSQVVAHLK